MIARRWHKLSLADLARLRVNLKKILPFIKTSDHNPRIAGLDDENLRARFAPPPQQLDLFCLRVDRGQRLYRLLRQPDRSKAEDDFTALVADFKKINELLEKSKR